MAVLATGQLTIVDYNDAISLAGFIKASRQKTQVYNKDGGGTWVPSWPTLNNVLTPELYIQAAGSAGVNLLTTGSGISGAKWSLQLYNDGVVDILAGASNASFGSVGAAAPFALTLNKNVMTEDKPSLEATFSCVYTDPTTGLGITFKTGISFSLMRSGGKSVVVQAFEANGDYAIRNGAAGAANLVMKFKLFRNGVEDTTITGSGVWKHRDPGATSWTTDQTTPFNNQNPDTVGNLSVPVSTLAAAINNSRTYRIEFTDTGAEAEASGTVYSDEFSILDFTDNYAVEIHSSAGDVFKNGVGTTIITPKLFQAGVEIDTTSAAFKRYRFTLRDKNGAVTYFKSSYDLATTLNGAKSAAATSIIVVSAGTSPRNIVIGDELVIEPGVSGKEEIVEVTSVSGTTIGCTALAYAHATGVAVKSANKKCGLTDSAKTITVTGDDIDVKGVLECEVLDA